MTIKFTAKRGVHFADLDISFKLDEDLSKNRSADPETGTDRVFSCEVDAAGAKALEALGDKVLSEYGISKSKSAKSED